MSVVSPAAQIDSNVQIGPFCVVEPGVILGSNCVLESHVVIRNGTVIGPDNHIFEGAVLGGLPQHAQMPEFPGKVVIGRGNTVRENVTIHRALEAESTTVLGDDNLVMVNAHIAHDCEVGSHVVITANVMIAGHVTIADRAYLSGAAGVHQFCRIGPLAMLGGQARVTKDVPPYVMVDGVSGLVVGLNRVGLRRAGFTLGEIRQLKAAYRVIYRSGLIWSEVLEQLAAEFSEGPAAEFHRFLATTERGILPERRMPPGATLKIHREKEEEATIRVQAG